MATRTVFTDGNNEMDCYLNVKGQVFINVGQIGEDNSIYNGFITLEKDDVKQLIKILTELEKEMTD